MSNFDDKCYAIAREEAEKHSESINQAVTAAERRIRRTSCFEEFKEQAITEAVRQLVQRARMTSNIQVRHPREDEHTEDEPADLGRPKVIPSRSRIVMDIETRTAKKYFGYKIDGRTLGSLLGRELLPLATKKKNLAETSWALGNILEQLAVIVPADKSVLGTVKPKKIIQIWEGAERAKELSA